MRMTSRFSFFVLVSLQIVFTAEIAFAARAGQLKLIVVDKQTKQQLPARIHLKNAAGRMAKPPKGAPTWKDHYVFDGATTLLLPNGNYKFELECGPEYLDMHGHFQIADFADD